jgi:hypothetical protein
MKAFVARGMTLGPETSVVNLVSVKKTVDLLLDMMTV